MKPFLILTVCVATAFGSKSRCASERQPQSLFNGRDLSGWHVDVPADSNVRVRNPFVVRNGMLVSLGEPRGHLITDSSYRDYRLEVEYRFPAAPGNAGVLVHASTPRALYGMFPRSIEVQMEHGNAGDFWCILEDIRVPDMERRRGPPAEWGTTEGKARRILNLTDSSEKPLGQWNTMVIEAVGRSIRVWVNGDLVNDGSDATADHGRIAVQSEGSEVEFRKLSLVPISRTTPERAPQVTAPTTRPAPPTRDPNSPGFVTANELPDGSVPPLDADGNFVIGPTHTPALEMVAHEGVPRGAVHTFTMSSADSKIFPGIARDSGTFGTVSPTDPATLVVTTSHPAPYTRTVAVYVPAQYVPGTIAPFIVGTDGPDQSLFTALDNLIAEKRVPVMIAISIGNGSGDAQGSERALEYDTMSGLYAEFVEREVLPLVERRYNVKLTKDPEGRATMGGSSGGSAAFIMAWYHPELYHRVLAYSITAVNQQWPHSAETPHGAWGFHERLIPNSPVKPIRVWLEVGDRDFLNPNVMRDDMHDWVVASENMAKVFGAKGYHYQFVFARNAGHVDRSVKQQTLPEALEWLWKGERPAAAR
jgi:enterochelin esterase family protein